MHPRVRTYPDAAFRWESRHSVIDKNHSLHCNPTRATTTKARTLADACTHGRTRTMHIRTNKKKEWGHNVGPIEMIEQGTYRFRAVWPGNLLAWVERDAARWWRWRCRSKRRGDDASAYWI